MWSNSTYLILFMHHKPLKSSNLTQIDAKALATSLTCILKIYLRFKGRKWCKLNHFRFWKIEKGLNEDISESRLMDYEERQDKNIMSLEDEEWPLQSKKKGTQTWEMMHEANSSSCMEVWNSKSDDNMYSKFEAKFRALLFQSLGSQESNASNGV